MATDAAQLAEVEWGEGEEVRVLKRWLAARRVHKRSRIIRSRQTDDFDFLILSATGMPTCYVEIKVRRRPLSAFKDAIAPVRKHEYAKNLVNLFRIPFVMVVEYPDALVEVDLAATPTSIRNLKRTDRPKAVPHAFWAGDQLEVIE